MGTVLILSLLFYKLDLSCFKSRIKMCNLLLLFNALQISIALQSRSVYSITQKFAHTFSTDNLLLFSFSPTRQLRTFNPQLLNIMLSRFFTVLFPHTRKVSFIQKRDYQLFFKQFRIHKHFCSRNITLFFTLFKYTREAKFFFYRKHGFKIFYEEKQFVQFCWLSNT